MLNSAGLRPASLAAGTTLYRVHPSGESPVKPVGDVLYASLRPETALVEELLPGIRFDRAGRRTVTRRLLLGKVLTTLRTTRELTLLALSEPPDNVLTWRDSQIGVSWPAVHDVPQRTIALFAADSVRQAAGLRIELDDPGGSRIVADLLAPYQVRVRLPKPADYPLVFLNYRSADDKEVVEKLDKELRRRLGDDAVFRDYRSMTAGQRFPEHLRTMASRAKVLLAIVGPRWEQARNPADWTGKEIALAFRHGRHVVPLLVGLRLRLSRDTLPDEIADLADRQYLTLREHYTDQDIATVVAELIAQVPLLAAAANRT